jgi:hypothetical protein
MDLVPERPLGISRTTWIIVAVLIVVLIVIGVLR